MKIHLHLKGRRGRGAPIAAEGTDGRDLTGQPTGDGLTKDGVNFEEETAGVHLLGETKSRQEAEEITLEDLDTLSETSLEVEDLDTLKDIT